VEVLAIPRADFMRVMDESPITAEAVNAIMQQRLEVQQASDKRSGTE
jgi:hypothetical protein